MFAHDKPVQEQSLVWTVRRLPYLIGFMISYAILSLLLCWNLKAPCIEAFLLWLGAAPFIAYAGWNALWISLSPRAYKLTPDNLNVYGSSTDPVHSIPLEKITYLDGERMVRGLIAFVAGGHAYFIPSWLSCSSRIVLEKLSRQIVDVQTPRHAPDFCSEETSADNGVLWPEYPQMPKRFRTMYQHARERKPDFRAYVFSGGKRKRTVERYVRWMLFGWFAVLGVSFFILVTALNLKFFFTRETREIPAIIASVTTLFVVLDFLSNWTARPQWLYIHSDGIELEGPESLSARWRDITHISALDLRENRGKRKGDIPMYSLMLSSGEVIVLYDVFDAAAPVICENIQRFWLASQKIKPLPKCANR